MDGLDFDSVRHRVKLVRDSGDTRLFENRDDVSCPVCGNAFDEALETSNSTRRLQPDSGIELCLARAPDRLFVFTHAYGPDSKN